VPRLTVPEIVNKLGLKSTSELRFQWRRLKGLGLERKLEQLSYIDEVAGC
jgi:hypothetical protein